MSLNTSISIKSHLLIKLKQQAKDENISLNFLIIGILKKTVLYYNSNYRQYRQIEYQKADDYDSLLIHHIRFDVTDYESFQLARYNLKISISKLLHIGFLLFCKLLKSTKGQKFKASNSYHNYIEKYKFLIEKFSRTLIKRE